LQGTLNPFSYTFIEVPSLKIKRSHTNTKIFSFSGNALHLVSPPNHKAFYAAIKYVPSTQQLIYKFFNGKWLERRECKNLADGTVTNMTPYSLEEIY